MNLGQNSIVSLCLHKQNLFGIFLLFSADVNIIPGKKLNIIVYLSIGNGTYGMLDGPQIYYCSLEIAFPVNRAHFTGCGFVQSVLFCIGCNAWFRAESRVI